MSPDFLIGNNNNQSMICGVICDFLLSNTYRIFDKLNYQLLYFGLNI